SVAELEIKDRQLEEKGRQLEEKGRQLEEKNRQLEEKGRQLEGKNRQLEEKDRQLEEKDLQLEKEGHQLEEKGHLLEEKNRQLEEKDRQLEEKNRQLDEKDRQLEKEGHQLEEKGHLLEEKNRQLEEKDRQLEEKNGQLEEKDRQLQEGNSLSQEKDIELSNQAKLLQFSTIGEYLMKCHVSYIPTVQMNADQRTPYGVTKLKERYGPTHANPWEGFLGEQKTIFEQVCKTIGPDLREFPRLITVEEIASNIRPIASEKELEMFINTYVENPVRHVMKKLFSVDPQDKVCQAEGKEVDFRYYYFSEDMDDITDTIEEHAAAQEVQGNKSTKASKSSTPEGTFRPDGMCVLIKWRAGQKGSILIFPYECKPPHNLTNENLDVVLKLLGSFWTAKKPEGITQRAWKSVRYALTQTYDYMIRSLSEFGILTTGTAIVFLRIDWASGAKSLQYHLARPAFDAAQASEADVAPLSAVGQYVSFIVRALRQSRHGDHKARMAIRERLPKVTMGTATNTNAASASSSGTAMR
ncbi:hypothetical protein E4U19_007862, partial [Claviceps sp. Clav32 group G5]